MRPLVIFFLAFLVAGCSAPSTNQEIANPDAPATASVTPDTFTDAEFPEEQPTESVTIDTDQAGTIRLGMSLAEVYQWFDSTQIHKVTTSQTPSSTFTYAISSAEAIPLLHITIAPSGTIISISIQNPAYQTKKGISVGSTFAQLSQAYHISQVYITHTWQVMATVEELQKKQYEAGKEQQLIVRFELGIDAAGLSQENNTLLPSSIPPDTRITRIVL